MPVIFVLDIFRQFLGTTAYSLGVTNAVPMLKGVAIYRLNTLRLITVTGAGHPICVTYEYENRDFSGLRKRSRCEIAFHTSDRPPLPSPYC